jgi:CheY-like chemotaxis protein
MKRNRILIVDDREDNLYLLRALLQGHGYEVDTAANGVQALAAARQDAPDLIIADILMPVMDGFTLCREWKKDESLKSIPFVFYTATYTDERDREFALSLGAERFIVKPEEPDLSMRCYRTLSTTPPAPSSPSTPSTAIPASTQSMRPR